MTSENKLSRVLTARELLRCDDDKFDPLNIDTSEIQTLFPMIKSN